MANIAPIRETPPVSSGGQSGGLGEKLKNALVSFLVDVVNRVKETLSDVIRHSVDSILETLEIPLLSIASPVLDRAIASPQVPSEVKAILQSARSGQNQIGAILLAFVSVMVLPPVVNALFSPAVKLVEYVGNKTFRPNRLDFGTWFAAGLRDSAYAGAMQRELEDQGWTQEQINAAKTVATTRLDVGSVLVAFHRGDLSQGEVSQRMTEMGIDTADLGLYFALSKALPSPQDLVRFAVREAWRDDIAEAWGFDQGRPGPFDEEMEKQGFDPWVSRAFWRSHWELPSIGLGFEMLHRDEITESELRELLVMQDIAPGWIAPVMAVAHPLPGRIDRRWAFEEGIIDLEQLRDLYLSDGMTSEWAGRMAQMVASRAVSEVKGLTRASVEKAYKVRRVSRADALEMLGELGIVSDIAAFYLDGVDYDVSQDVLDRRVGIVGKRYIAALVTSQQARDALYDLGVVGDETDLLLDDWSLRVRSVVSRPTRTNLDEFFTQDVIGVDSYRSQMQLLGYDPVYVGWYLGSLAFESAVRAAQEQERAAQELERLEVGRKASAYQLGKARVDRQIADVKAAIADLKVALVELGNARDVELAQSIAEADRIDLEREYHPLFIEADSQIAQARVAIQDMRAQIVTLSNEVSEKDRAVVLGRDFVREREIASDRLSRQTAIALVATQVAQVKTDIARLQQSLPLLVIPEEFGQAELDVLALKTRIRELEQEQADERLEIERLDELVPVDLSPERQVEIAGEIAGLEREREGLRSEIESVDTLVLQMQIDRAELDLELDLLLTALPGEREKIAIRASYASKMDVLELGLSELGRELAELRLEKADLVVQRRESGA